MAQPICFIGSIDHDGSWISNAVDRVVQKRFEAVHEILATQGQSMTDILKYVKDISTTLRIQTSASTRPDFRAASYPQKGRPPGETTQTPVESTAEAPRKMFRAASPQKGQTLGESTTEAPRKMFPAASYPQKGQTPVGSTTELPRKMWQPRATVESNLPVNGTKPETQELAGKVVNILPDERTFINAKTPPVFSLNHPADPRAFDPQLNSFMGENVHDKHAGLHGTGYEKGKSKGKMRKQGDTPKGETRKGGRDRFGLTPKGKGHASLPVPSGVAHQEAQKVSQESEKPNQAPHVGTPSARKRTTSQPLGNVRVKAPRTVGPAKVSPSSPSSSSRMLHTPQTAPSSSSRMLPTPQTLPDGGASSDSGSEDLEEAMASLLDVAQNSIDEKHAPISVPNLAPHANSPPQGDSRVVSFPTAPNEDGTSTRQKNDLLRGAEEMVSPGSVTALARKRKVRAHPVSDSKITFPQDTVPSEQRTHNVAQSIAETPRVDGQTPIEIPRADGQTLTRETARMNGQTPTRETSRMNGQTPTRETSRMNGQTPTRETPRVDGQTLTRETPRVDGQTPPRETPRMDGQTPRETPVSGKKFSMKRKKRPKRASGDAENSQSAGSGRRTWAETMYEKPSHAKLVSLPSQSKTDILSFMQPSKVISSGELQF